MKGLADKGEREEKRRNEGQKGLGDMNPLTHITITQSYCPHSLLTQVRQSASSKDHVPTHVAGPMRPTPPRALLKTFFLLPW